MFVGQSVNTPYGLGKVTLIRDETHCIVTPSSWEMNAGQKPVFYLNSKDVSPTFPVGSIINCAFGCGTIISIRDTDCIYIVELSQWKLANGKSPTLYLNEQSLNNTVVKSNENTKIQEDKKRNYASECLAKSLDAKNLAAEYFKKSELHNAKSMYLESLEALQYLGDDLTNEEKAKVFEQSVLCNNNAALCCLRLKQYSDSLVYGKSALMLIETLEVRIPSAKVWECLLATGMTLEKYRKEWKKKSLFLIGKAELGLCNYESSLDRLKLALQLIVDDESLSKHVEELKGLIAQAQTKLKSERKKEKATWSKAFEKGKLSENSLYSDPASDIADSSTPVNSPKKPLEWINGVPQVDLAKVGLVKPPAKAATANKNKNGTLWKPTPLSISFAMLFVAGLGVGGYFLTKLLNSKRR